MGIGNVSLIKTDSHLAVAVLVKGDLLLILKTDESCYKYI